MILQDKCVFMSFLCCILLFSVDDVFGGGLGGSVASCPTLSGGK